MVALTERLLLSIKRSLEQTPLHIIEMSVYPVFEQLTRFLIVFVCDVKFLIECVKLILIGLLILVYILNAGADTVKRFLCSKEFQHLIVSDSDGLTLLFEFG